MLTSFLLIILWLGIIPFACGVLFADKVSPHTSNPLACAVMGYMAVLALFQVVYTPILMLGGNFIQVVYISCVAIMIFCVISIWLGRKLLVRWFKKSASYQKQRFLWIIPLVLILFQIVMSVLYQFSDGDDAFYVAESVLTEGSNTLFKIEAYTGYATAHFDKHALSSGPVFVAFLSRLTHMHPAVMSHFVLPVFLIAITYIIYGSIGNIIFFGKSGGGAIFLSAISLLNIFGNVSIFTPATFFITRTWQGKSWLANIFLPMIFLILLILAEETKIVRKTNKKPKNLIPLWLFLITVMVAGISATSMAIYLMPLLGVSGAAIISIRRKNIRVLVKFIAACLVFLPFAILLLTIRV